jgi:hypothetical protein
MFWLSAVSLVAGGLLASRFKIFVLAPATLVIVVIAIAVGELQSTDIRSIIFTIAIASVGVQVGYFFVMMIQYRLSALSQGVSRSSSDKTTGRPPSISRTSAP